MELSSNPGVPRKFPRLPRKFPKLPRKFPDFPGGQPLSLGSLTPSPDSQKLSLNLEFALNNRDLIKAEVFEKRVFEQMAPLQ